MVRNRDEQRIALNRQVIRSHNLDAVVCALPANVRLLSGYCPVVGDSIVIATPESTILVVPSDEEQLAHSGWADEVRTFEDGSLKKIETLLEAVRPTLSDALHTLKIRRTAIGYEHGPWLQTASYAAMALYGASMLALLGDCLPEATLNSADDLLQQLRLVKTPIEISHIRDACRIAATAFTDGVGHIRAGETETETAAHFQGKLLQSADGDRAAGFAFCMSGPNAANAYRAYQRSSQRVLKHRDLALVHCNSSKNGFWNDITRTYCLGSPTGKQQEMYEAVFAARQAALKAIRPGARAADVDRAARSVLTERGFGKQFKHPVGHGVGFGAINHNAKPRLHPLSDETLEVGMVFNIEPAIYFDGECGMRHCEMVAVAEHGADVLTTFQNEMNRLVLSG